MLDFLICPGNFCRDPVWSWGGSCVLSPEPFVLAFLVIAPLVRWSWGRAREFWGGAREFWGAAREFWDRTRELFACPRALGAWVPGNLGNGAERALALAVGRRSNTQYV